MKRFYVFIILFFALCTVFRAADLVRDGKGAAVLVMGDRPTVSAQFAAAELQYHIRKISGAELPISSRPEEGKTRIYVGCVPEGQKQPVFADQEYRIDVSGDSIILIGKDDPDFRKFDYGKDSTFPDIWSGTGSCGAVYDFLEMLGVRWYLPTELGLHFVPSKDLSVSDMKIQRCPTMEYRDPIWYGFRADLTGDTMKTGPRPPALSGREMKLWKLRSRIGGRPFHINHSFYSFYKRFPEKKDWFAQGYEGQPPQMCFSSEEFFRQVVQDARDYFDGKASPSVAGMHRAGLDCFPVWPMDNASWCKCEKCQAQLLPEATMGQGNFHNNRASNYVFSFVNRVAKEIRKSHPGKLIGTGAYHEYAYPPEGFELEDNIRVVLCQNVRSVYSPDTMANGKKIMDAWTERCPAVKKNVWLYFCFPTLSGCQQGVRVFPGFFAGHVEKIFREFESSGVKGIFVETSYGIEAQIMILFDQLEGYLLWKLAWDGTSDGNRIIDDFFRNYYGPAEKPMKSIYMLIQERYCNPEYRTQKGSVETVSWSLLGTEEVMKRIERDMEEAERLASEEPYKARVALFKKGVADYMAEGRNSFVKRAAVMSGSMMQADVPFVKAERPGEPDSVPWAKAANLKLYGGLRAEEPKEKLEVKVAHDGEWIYLSCVHKEVDPDSLLTRNFLWQNDEWECYFAKQRDRPYQMFGVDSVGGMAGEKVLELNRNDWIKPARSVTRKEKDSWTTLLALKLSEIVPGGIRPGETLYFNVLRARDNKAIGCWIPTFGGFHAPERFGELYLVPEK